MTEQIAKPEDIKRLARQVEQSRLMEFLRKREMETIVKRVISECMACLLTSDEFYAYRTVVLADDFFDLETFPSYLNLIKNGLLIEFTLTDGLKAGASVVVPTDALIKKLDEYFAKMA